MAKKNITISVEDEIHAAFKEKVGNVSEALNEYMKDYTGIKLDLSEDIIKLKIKEFAPIVAEHKNLLDELARVQANRKSEELKREVARLEEEQKAKSCYYCGNIIDPSKGHKFSNGAVCKGCFLGGAIKLKGSELTRG